MAEKTDEESAPRRRNASTRLIVMLVAGIIAAAITGLSWDWQFATAVGWIAAAFVYSAWIWILIGSLDATKTKSRASREDPTRGISDLLIVLLSIASLSTVVITLVQASTAHGAMKGVLAGIALGNVAFSWILLHTLFTLHYARIYYTDGGTGVNFNQDDPPRYLDFAYLSFTLGMTYQVSDTNLTTFRIRSLALRHALLSFLFGSIILATTINLIVGLTSGG
ncbi:DUF1345 domain-containing protein [Parafrigoribacterium humi]|uniref:DUF1345 domain-containing protein n=1 Tax=Parafrigoribacterium humi TaxID=3144664 RepID=UPI0032ECEDEE